MRSGHRRKREEDLPSAASDRQAQARGGRPPFSNNRKRLSCTGIVGPIAGLQSAGTVLMWRSVGVLNRPRLVGWVLFLLAFVSAPLVPALSQESTSAVPAAAEVLYSQDIGRGRADVVARVSAANNGSDSPNLAGVVVSNSSNTVVLAGEVQFG